MNAAEQEAAKPRLKRIRNAVLSFGKGPLYTVGFIFLAYVVLVIFFDIVEEGAMWLFPESKFSYTSKYNLSDDKVLIDRKPCDCEWETAPLGAKHCHYEKIVQTQKDQNGNVTEVYVNWQKVED